MSDLIIRHWKLLSILWILSSVGIAGIITAMAHKPQATTIQRIKPIHDINRAGKSDKIGFKLTPGPQTPQLTPLPTPTPVPAPAPMWTRKFWYA